jgi:multicomponent K+:H+ antiporter subunit F
MNALFELAVTFAQFCFALAMIFATIRLLRGPTAQDRTLALDTLYVSSMMMLVVLGIHSSTTVYTDIALVIALFGFVGSVALAKFLLGREVIEP